MPYLAFLRKLVFLEKPFCFSKTPMLRSFWSVLLFQAHCTANVLQVGGKFFFFRNMNEHVNAIGKHRPKKQSNWEEGFPCTFYVYGGKKEFKKYIVGCPYLETSKIMLRIILQLTVQTPDFYGYFLFRTGKKICAGFLGKCSEVRRETKRKIGTFLFCSSF